MSRLVKARALPLPLTEPDLSSVIVSTIHRAKGLEFDSVYVVEPTRRPRGRGRWIVYAGLRCVQSCARRDFLCSLPRPKSSIYADKRYHGRFKEEVFSRSKKGAKWTRAFEFQYSDVETAYPAFSHGVSAQQVQETLRSAGLVGLSVTAELDEYESDDERPSYLLVDGKWTAGRANERSVRRCLRALLQVSRPYPQVIDGLSLVSVETVAGDPREVGEG